MGRFDELNGEQLDAAFAAADLLLSMSDRLDPTLVTKLAELHADLGAERQERRRLAQS
jgi:hypothetical protein